MNWNRIKCYFYGHIYSYFVEGNPILQLQFWCRRCGEWRSPSSKSIFER